MHNAENQRVFVFHAVHNHVFPHGGAAVTGTEVFPTGTPDIEEKGVVA
jgi:hypothetical protein